MIYDKSQIFDEFVWNYKDMSFMIGNRINDSLSMVIQDL